MISTSGFASETLKFAGLGDAGLLPGTSGDQQLFALEALVGQAELTSCRSFISKLGSLRAASASIAGRNADGGKRKHQHRIVAADFMSPRAGAEVALHPVLRNCRSIRPTTMSGPS